MRTCTILVSIAAHALVVVAVVVRTVIATDTLPEPRRASEFLIVKPALPNVPPAALRQARTTPPPVSPNAAPLEAPQGITPETPPALADVAPDNGVGVIGGDSALVEPTPPPPAPPRDTRPAQTAPVRVGGQIEPPQRVVTTAPVYPPIARSARVSGIVILEAVIGEDGTVRDVRVLRSIPLLDQAAIDAVRQWRFRPTLLNRQPVPVVMTVTVTFNLQ